ncbi:MAG: hypothetical protein JSS86_05410 [Cyanobacteria bacterium SZAS LIN-2]|nr:hypothetical protein [Cyanobacteria bacterium SZAS LIN-2]
MFAPAKKLLVIPMLLVFLAGGLFQAARSESAPRATFYSYIRALYYAKRVKQVSKYWIKNGRVPMDECLGTAEQAKLAELKSGYIYEPKILTEVIDGNVCTMKGVGWGSSQGHRLRAKLDVVMIFEEGSWKIQYYTWQGEIPGHY